MRVCFYHWKEEGLALITTAWNEQFLRTVCTSFSSSSFKIQCRVGCGFIQMENLKFLGKISSLRFQNYQKLLLLTFFIPMQKKTWKVEHLPCWTKVLFFHEDASASKEVIRWKMTDKENLFADNWTNNSQQFIWYILFANLS